MPKTIKYILLLSLFVKLHVVLPQQYYPGVDEKNPLKEFQLIESPAEKFDYFVKSVDPYTESSGYDWLETVNVYLSSAQKTKDSFQITIYQILEAKIYSDLGDYNKGLTLAKGIYDQRASLPKGQLEVLFSVLDTSYGGLRMYDRQIEVRREKREYGFSTQIQFYDIYTNMGMYRRAMEDYIDDVANTINDDEHLRKAAYHNTIGNYLRLDNSFATALVELNKAKGFLEVYINDITVEKSKSDILESELMEAVIAGNIGKCMVAVKSYAEAIPFFEKSLEQLRALAPKREREEIINNTLSFAEAELQLDHKSRAYQLLTTNFDNMTIRQVQLKNRLLGNYYNRVQNYRLASEYFKQNDRIADSLKRNELFILKQQLNEIVGESDNENRLYRAEEQRRENEEMKNLLKDTKQRNSIIIVSLVFTLLGFGGLIFAYLRSIKAQKLIENQKTIIEGQLKEKESLLREIHHRVKNNLQMVSSLLSLQTKNTKSKAAILALEEGKSRVKAMALIHQKLYQNEDLSFIEMQGYIESLINSVQSVYKKGGHNISITIDAEGTELDIDRAIPFGLILNELVSNSFKYAFPNSDENGKIYIHLRKNGDQGFFEYTDNGVGLPEEVDERNHTSMGLRLINRLVNQLQSKLSIDRNVEGIRFWFTFS